MSFRRAQSRCLPFPQLGQSLPFPIVLGAPSGPAGVVVTLTSSNPAVVKIAPTSVYIPAGQTMPATQPEVLGENIGATTITASAPDYVTTSQVTPVTATITIAPKSLNIPVGGTQLISLILSSSAPSIGVPITPDRAAGGFVEGLTVQLSSSDPRIASIQPTVQFYPDGSSITTVLVVVVGQASGVAVIHASAPPFIPDSTTTVIVGNPGPTATSITSSGGTPQTAQVNTPFGLPLSAIVRDAGSNPVSGVTVTFALFGKRSGRDVCRRSEHRHYGCFGAGEVPDSYGKRSGRDIHGHGIGRRSSDAGGLHADESGLLPARSAFPAM